MCKKVSIIIPNYNGEKFIAKCINSVIDQDYKNKEIIIIDDGSTDNSKNIIQSFINNKDVKISFQHNLNASIARNEGLKIATGDYVLFLDSDDILCENVISSVVSEMERNRADLLIGNYNNIDENGNVVEENRSINSSKCYSGEDILANLFDINPVPSTKLYRMDIIKNNDLYWGNVRIGQDLDFYLKYLLCCRNVTVSEIVMYNYRILKNSISRSFNYRIFDIVSSFDDVIKFYKSKNSYNLYEKYIQILELRHYNRQIEKQKYFKKRLERKLVTEFFFLQEKRINYKKCLNYNEFYKKIHLKFRIKKIMSIIYISKLYSYIKK